MRRDFLVLAALMAAAAPASGQTAPGTGVIPDFSGLWGHPYLPPGFEPPLSGPGPVTRRKYA
jgi:hypothetical protein